MGESRPAHLGRVYRPHCVRSVLTTSVKILPYRPPARLIRCLLYGKKEKFTSFNETGLLTFCLQTEMSLT